MFIPPPRVLLFSLLGQEEKGWHNGQLLWLKTIIQGHRTFSECAWDPVFASLNSHRNRPSLSGGVAAGPVVLESVLTFPDLVHSSIPSCLSVGNNFAFLWGAAFSPLGVGLAGWSVTVWLICFPLRARKLRWPLPEAIQAFPPHASGTNITALSKTNTRGEGRTDTPP